MEEKPCKGDHEVHICVLASKGLFDRIMKITKVCDRLYPNSFVLKRISSNCRPGINHVFLSGG